MKPLWALGTTQLFRYILCFLQVSHDFKSFTWLGANSGFQNFDWTSMNCRLFFVKTIFSNSYLYHSTRPAGKAFLKPTADTKIEHAYLELGSNTLLNLL